jgi:hypothetical protein
LGPVEDCRTGLELDFVFVKSFGQFGVKNDAADRAYAHVGRNERAYPLDAISDLEFRHNAANVTSITTSEQSVFVLLRGVVSL